MSGAAKAIGSVFSGPPKPKRDKDAERRLAEAERLEKLRSDSADRAIASSRRARNAKGIGRAGLAYVPPVSGGPGATLG